MTHSPEPWKLGRCFDADCIADASGEDVYGTDEEIARVDLERIVACVNACAGIPTDVLAAVGDKGWLADVAAIWQKHHTLDTP